MSKITKPEVQQIVDLVKKTFDDSDFIIAKHRYGFKVKKLDGWFGSSITTFIEAKDDLSPRHSVTIVGSNLFIY